MQSIFCQYLRICVIIWGHECSTSRGHDFCRHRNSIQVIYFEINGKHSLVNMAGTRSGQADGAKSGLIWVESLSVLPKIIYLNIQEHLKSIGEKFYRHFVESYIHDVHVAVIPGGIPRSKHGVIEPRKK